MSHQGEAVEFAGHPGGLSAYRKVALLVLAVVATISDSWIAVRDSDLVYSFAGSAPPPTESQQTEIINSSLYTLDRAGLWNACLATPRRLVERAGVENQARCVTEGGTGGICPIIERHRSEALLFEPVYGAMDSFCLNLEETREAVYADLAGEDYKPEQAAAASFALGTIFFGVITLVLAFELYNRREFNRAQVPWWLWWAANGCCWMTMCCAVVTLGIFTSIINGVADDAEDMGAQGLSGFRDLYSSGWSMWVATTVFSVVQVPGVLLFAWKRDPAERIEGPQDAPRGRSWKDVWEPYWGVVWPFGQQSWMFLWAALMALSMVVLAVVAMSSDWWIHVTPGDVRDALSDVTTQRQYLDVIESIAFRVDHAGLFRVCMDTPTGLNTKLEGVSESECQNQPTAVQCVMKSDVSALEPLFSQTYPDVEALCLTTTDSEDVWRNVLGEDYRDSINAARAFAIIAGFFGALVLAYLIHYHDVRESRCTVPKGYVVWLLHSTWALCLLAAVTTLGIFSGIVDDFAESMPGPAEKINQFSDYQDWAWAMWVATSCIALVQGVWIVFYTVMKVPEREEGSRKQPLMGHGEAQV